MGKKFKSHWCCAIVCTIIISLLFSIEQSVEAKEPKWVIKLKQIKVFESTRTDVERIFNNTKVKKIYNKAKKEKDGWAKTVTYKTKFGKLIVDYSTGNCSESQNIYAYNVESDRVVDFTFYPTKKIKIDQFNYNLQEFEHSSNNDVYGAYSLSNAEDGIRILVTEEGVESIEFIHPITFSSYDCELILKK